MQGAETLPERLYKYRTFNKQTLELLVGDELYFADPSTFNDPFDSRPSLETDIQDEDLVRTLMTLVIQRTTQEMRHHLAAAGAKGPRAEAYIGRRSREEADRCIAEIDYYATEPDFDPFEYRRSLLGHKIQNEVLRQYEKGVVSLAARDDCPLMWSHYGDQHGGVCIGYSIPDDTAGDVRKIQYGGSRIVKASMVAQMLAGDDAARREVDQAVLLRKAESWGYEQEWRMIGRRGVQSSTLELEEVTFGLKCEEEVKYTVMKLLQNRDRRVKFYEMREEFGTFELKKDEVTYDDELFVHFPRRHLSILELLKPHAED